MQGNEKMLEIESGSTRSHSADSSPWKSLRACRKTDYVMIMEIIVVGTVIIATFDNPSSSLRGIRFLLLLKQHPDDRRTTLSRPTVGSLWAT